jgi:hypothetical protein
MKYEHKEKKSYDGSRGFLNLGGLLSGSRGVGGRNSLSGLSLLDGGNGSGNSFGGRHYNNRDRDGLQRQPVRKVKEVMKGWKTLRTRRYYRRGEREGEARPLEERRERRKREIRSAGGVRPPLIHVWLRPREPNNG